MKETTIDIFNADTSTYMPMPYAGQGIQAGFPSPAQDYISETIDLNRELIRHPSATFYGRVSGDSMIEEGIEEGDIIVIDRAIEPRDGDLAVCCVDGDFTLKHIKIEGDHAWLIPANESFDPILVTGENKFSIWGVVTYTIKKAHRR